MAQPPERHDEGPDQRMVRALDHPVRVSFLKLLAERGSVSPPEALSQLGNPELGLSNVAYHAWVLEHLELIEAAGEQDRDGTPFRATTKGEAALMALGFSG